MAEPAVVVGATVAIVAVAPVAIVVVAPVAHEGARMGASTGARMAAANMAAANMAAATALGCGVDWCQSFKTQKKGAFIAVVHRSRSGGATVNNKRIFDRSLSNV